MLQQRVMVCPSIGVGGHMVGMMKHRSALFPCQGVEAIILGPARCCRLADRLLCTHELL